VKWFTAFIAAMMMLVTFTTLQTVLDSRRTVNKTNDQLQCVLYELNAHRVEAQRDGDRVDPNREPKTEPALDLPARLRASCEEILPGSTDRGNG
jgi:hypothetical protein